MFKSIIKNLRIRGDSPENKENEIQQDNFNQIRKSEYKKYRDLIRVIYSELGHQKRCIREGLFSTSEEIENIRGSIKTLEMLVWYIANNQYESEEQEND